MGSVDGAKATGGGAPIIRQSGHSKVWACEGARSASPPVKAMLTTPALVQTMANAGVLTMGEATATPSASANHTSTKRVS